MFPAFCETKLATSEMSRGKNKSKNIKRRSIEISNFYIEIENFSWRTWSKLQKEKNYVICFHIYLSMLIVLLDW